MGHVNTGSLRGIIILGALRFDSSQSRFLHEHSKSIGFFVFVIYLMVVGVIAVFNTWLGQLRGFPLPLLALFAETCLLSGK